MLSVIDLRCDQSQAVLLMLAAVVLVRSPRCRSGSRSRPGKPRIDLDPAGQRLGGNGEGAAVEPANEHNGSTTFAAAAATIEKLCGDVDREPIPAAAVQVRARTDKLAAGFFRTSPRSKAMSAMLIACAALMSAGSMVRLAGSDMAPPCLGI
jgi:hypothetical protein